MEVDSTRCVLRPSPLSCSCPYSLCSRTWPSHLFPTHAGTVLTQVFAHASPLWNTLPQLADKAWIKWHLLREAFTDHWLELAPDSHSLPLIRKSHPAWFRPAAAHAAPPAAAPLVSSSHISCSPRAGTWHHHEPGTHPLSLVVTPRIMSGLGPGQAGLAQSGAGASGYSLPSGLSSGPLVTVGSSRSNRSRSPETATAQRGCAMRPALLIH